MKKNSLILFFLLLISPFAKAQFVDYGQDPAALRWKQINTRNFQLIYPDYFEENAQRIANIFHTLYQQSNTLDHKPVKVSMILHPNGGISNGSVTWAPKRTDLYTMPPADPSDSWLEHLCVHEFRHVVQIDKVNQGLTRVLYYLFGEQITIAVTGVYLPLWFMEGDAVTYETALGHLGRGRSPEFLNEMKAQVVEKGIYSYYKACLGSYKDFVPNRYTMGYFMVGNSRANYGPEIWTDALNRIGRRPLSLAPFTHSLKKTLKAGRNRLWQDSTFRSLFIDPQQVKEANTYRDAKRTLYHDNFSELQQIWKKEMQPVRTPFDTLPTHNKAYTSYYYPTPADSTQFISYKKGLRETGAFVKIREGKEQIITRTAPLDDAKYTYHRNFLVWTEYLPHLRWEHGGRMTLVSYNLKTGRYRYHRAPNNRFSPFPLEDKWGVVEIDPENRASIVILSGDFQQELQRIPAGKNEIFIRPSYQNGRITTVVQNRQGISVESISAIDGKRQQLTQPVWYELDNPIRTDSVLWFRASYNGNNAFYRKNLAQDTVFNVLNSPFGLRFPRLDPQEKQLYFSFYTSDGYKPGKIALEKLEQAPVYLATYYLADTLTRQEGWQFSSGNDSVFHSKAYHKLPHLINPHSWGPLYIDQLNQEIHAGIIVYSQNKLSTLSLAAGYITDSDYDHGAWTLSASYKALWPVFTLEFKTGKNDYSRFGEQILNRHTQQREDLYLHTRAGYTQGKFLTQLPLNLSVRNYSRYLTPYAGYEIKAIHHSRVKKAYHYYRQNDTLYIRPVVPADYHLPLSPNYYQMLEYGLIFSNQTHMTVQEIHPRWGQTLQGGFAHTPLKKLNFGHEWWVAGNFYFPGLFRNHSLNLYMGHQKRPDDYFYDKRILSPRGIDIYSPEFTTFRSSYELPLLFPDQHITSLIYIKAIHGGLFFDTTRQRTAWKKNTCSYGAELTADLHLLRLPFPVNIGLRSGYETQTRSMFTDFLFTIGFHI